LPIRSSAIRCTCSTATEYYPLRLTARVLGFGRGARPHVRPDSLLGNPGNAPDREQRIGEIWDGIQPPHLRVGHQDGQRGHQRGDERELDARQARHQPAVESRVGRDAEAVLETLPEGAAAEGRVPNRGDRRGEQHRAPRVVSETISPNTRPRTPPVSVIPAARASNASVSASANVTQTGRVDVGQVRPPEKTVASSQGPLFRGCRTVDGAGRLRLLRRQYPGSGLEPAEVGVRRGTRQHFDPPLVEFLHLDRHPGFHFGSRR